MIIETMIMSIEKNLKFHDQVVTIFVLGSSLRFFVLIDEGIVI